ncbi:hypothetical protein FRC00_008306, partial [Tulasnella sp. 408]
MVSQNHQDEYDFWAGDFPSDVPPSLNTEDTNLYNAFNASPAHLHGGPTPNGDFTSQHPGNISGVGTPGSSMDDYELHFGAHSPVAPALPSPPSPPPLEFDEIINILALAPNEASGPSLMMQGSLAPTPDQASPIPVPGPAPVQVPTFPQAHHAPFEGPPMSVSLPYRLGSSQGPMYPAFHSTPGTAFNGTFRVPFQDLAPSPSRMASPPAGPVQHIIHFDLDNPQNQDSAVPPTIQPSSIPIPASPSDDSSFTS